MQSQQVWTLQIRGAMLKQRAHRPVKPLRARRRLPHRRAQRPAGARCLLRSTSRGPPTLRPPPPAATCTYTPCSRKAPMPGRAWVYCTTTSCCCTSATVRGPRQRAVFSAPRASDCRHGPRPPQAHRAAAASPAPPAAAQGCACLTQLNQFPQSAETSMNPLPPQTTPSAPSASRGCTPRWRSGGSRAAASSCPRDRCAAYGACMHAASQRPQRLPLQAVPALTAAWQLHAVANAQLLATPAHRRSTRSCTARTRRST